MPHPSDTGPAANADGSTAVRPHLQLRVDTQVLGDGHEPHPLCRALDDAGELGLPRAEGDGLLGGGPVLD
eukprot:4602311-Alexandrium_andersonii.AAC.1